MTEIYHLQYYLPVQYVYNMAGVFGIWMEDANTQLAFVYIRHFVELVSIQF